MFADLNIPTSNNRSELTQRITKAKNLGYNAVAINRIVSGTLQPNQHKCTFVPVTMNTEDTETSSLVLGQKGFQQYSRLTVKLDNPNQIHSLNPSSPVIRSYDLLAIQPSTEKLFQQACSPPLEVDIITLEQNTRQSFPLRVPTIKMALERGIYFEIQYSQALSTPMECRYLMANALNLIRVTKGKNILFSSGANSVTELRSPYDVASLAHLFGLNYQEAQNSLSNNATAVLNHAYTRKTHKSVIAAEGIEELPEYDKAWKVPQESIPEIGKKRKRNQ